MGQVLWIHCFYHNGRTDLYPCLRNTFLSKERELDTKIVEELDRERMQAELDVLNNELDPHFIFNALNTLNHLIITNPDTAYVFNSRLAQVYKYVLMNKNKELVSLFKELEFIEKLFFPFAGSL
jgi:LytS/YehU family sensor histidine kinase